MAAIVAAEPPALSSLQLRRRPARAAIRRCLAKDPEDRWQTARDMAAELRWIAEAGSSEEASARVDTARPRRVALWGAVVGAALAAAGAAATLRVIWPEPSVAEYLPVTYRKGAVSSARFTPDGQSFVYSATWDGQALRLVPGSSREPRCARSPVERLADHVCFARRRDGRGIRAAEHHPHIRRPRPLAHSHGRRGTTRCAHRGSRRGLDSRKRCARRHS